MIANIIRFFVIHQISLMSKQKTTCCKKNIVLNSYQVWSIIINVNINSDQYIFTNINSTHTMKKNSKFRWKAMSSHMV